MNARIIKETRSLLPVFGVTLLAAVVPPLIWKPDTEYGVGLIAFVACSALLGASCLGNEFQWRTLPLLLSQPVSRGRLWLEKMLVLGSALTVGFVVFLACAHVPGLREDNTTRWTLALIPLCVFCGAPCLALAVKNTIGAAVLTVLMPYVGVGLLALLEHGLAWVFPAAGNLFEKSFEQHDLVYLTVYAAIYCSGFGWLGYAMFLRLQAVDSQSRDLNLPPRMEAVLARPLRLVVPGYTGPWASLFRKELQLHRPSFIIAGLMIALAPLEVLAWKLFHSDFFGALEGVNLVMLVFAIPLIATGMSVAEERNLGVAGWQFIQPVSARRQWAAKMLVVLFICVTLGVLLPAAGAVIGNVLFNVPKLPDHLFPGAPLPAVFLTAFVLIFTYLLLLSVGIFASSVSKTTLQAVIHAIAVIVLGVCMVKIIFWAGEDFLFYYADHHPNTLFHSTATAGQIKQLSGDELILAQNVMGSILMLVEVLLFVMLLGVVQFLAYANFRKGEQAAHHGWIKSGVLLIIIGGFAWAMILATVFIPVVLMPILFKQ